MPKFKAGARLCVFCGSRSGRRPAYMRSAGELGRLLAEAGVGLVYGGGRVGLMGELAGSALAAGGEVIGVVPEWLVRREAADAPLTEMHLVDTLGERKQRMAELSDGFIALPGGIGTLDELLEMWTWAQLGVHDKPCCLISVESYYASLQSQLDEAVAEGFLDVPDRERMHITDSVPDALAFLGVALARSA